MPRRNMPFPKKTSSTENAVWFGPHIFTKHVLDLQLGLQPWMGVCLCLLVVHDVSFLPRLGE